MSEKIFVGKVFKGKYSTNLTLSREDLDKLSMYSENGKVTIAVKESKKGTLYAEIDTWQQPVRTTEGR